MAKRAKPAAKRPAAVKRPRVASGELRTLLDFVRYATSRFIEARLAFAHGTTDPVAEAAFLVCETCIPTSTKRLRWRGSRPTRPKPSST